MKMQIKTSFMFLLFLTAANLTFAQTKKTTKPKATTPVSEEIVAPVEDLATDTTTAVVNTETQKEYINNLNSQSNTDTQEEYVKGKRRKNEFSSGGGGGQFNNPHPNAVAPKPKVTTGAGL